MHNSENEAICHASYKKTVERLNDTLFENLVLADGDEGLEQKAREKYRKGKRLAQKTLKICLEES